MEDLNQRQLVLLVILVSFVTSIATGIMTVSLLDYAPPVVTQNVERVIERTVEYVSPQEEESEPKQVTEIREVVEQRIIDRGDDIIIETNEEMRPAGVSIMDKDGDLMGRGLIVSSTEALLPFTSEKDTVFDIKVAGREDPIRVKVLFSSQEGFSIAEVKDESRFSSFKIAETTPKVGATVLHIGGVERDELYVGRVAWLDGSEEDGFKVLGIEGIQATSPGSFLVNLSGDIWGVQINGVAGQYLSTSFVKEVIERHKSGAEDIEGDDVSLGEDSEHSS